MKYHYILLIFVFCFAIISTSFANPITITKGDSAKIDVRDEIPKDCYFYCVSWCPDTGMDDPHAAVVKAAPQNSLTYTYTFCNNPFNQISGPVEVQVQGEDRLPTTGDFGRNLWKNHYKKQSCEWYRSEQAEKIARSIMSWQIDESGGGWGTDGDKINWEEEYSGGKKSNWKDANGDYIIGTIDDGATITHMRFLATFYKCNCKQRSDLLEEVKTSFNEGLSFLSLLQTGNGGFKQVNPTRAKEGETHYSDNTTLNDNATMNVIELFSDIYLEKGEFKPDKDKQGEDDAESIIIDDKNTVEASLTSGINFFVDAQIKEGETRMGWAQQYDPDSYEPRPGRKYEPIAMATVESSLAIQLLERISGELQGLDGVDWGEVTTAINTGKQWLEDRKRQFYLYRSTLEVKGSLQYDPDTGRVNPVSARFYAIAGKTPTPQTGSAFKTNEPVFAGYSTKTEHFLQSIRDKSDNNTNVYHRNQITIIMVEENGQQVPKNSMNRIDTYAWHSFEPTAENEDHTWIGQPTQGRTIQHQCHMPLHQLISIDDTKPDTLIAYVPTASAPEVFTYEWSNGRKKIALKDTITNLTAPKYCVTVTDKNNCLGVCCIEFGSPGGSGSGSGSGSGTSSNTTKKLIETPNIPSIIAPELSLDIFPNPVQSDMTISVNSSTSDLLQLQIFNLNGQAIYQEQNYVLKGNYERRLTLPDDIPNGIYFVRVQTEMGSAMKKIVVAR